MIILREMDDGTFTEKPCRLDLIDTARKTTGFLYIDFPKKITPLILFGRNSRLIHWLEHARTTLSKYFKIASWKL
jgi:hypothetical protein